jgi:hypothetical protein
MLAGTFASLLPHDLDAVAEIALQGRRLLRPHILAEDEVPFSSGL